MKKKKKVIYQLGSCGGLKYTKWEFWSLNRQYFTFFRFFFPSAKWRLNCMQNVYQFAWNCCRVIFIFLFVLIWYLTFLFLVFVLINFISLKEKGRILSKANKKFNLYVKWEIYFKVFKSDLELIIKWKLLSAP